MISCTVSSSRSSPRGSSAALADSMVSRALPGIPELQAAVVALDHTTFDVAQDAFVELGFSPLDAHARATALVYVGIGYMQGGERVEAPTEDDKRIFVEMLIRR